MAQSKIPRKVPIAYPRKIDGPPEDNDLLNMSIKFPEGHFFDDGTEMNNYFMEKALRAQSKNTRAALKSWIKNNMYKELGPLC